MKTLNNSKKYSILLTIVLLMSTLTIAAAYVAAPASAQASSDWSQFGYTTDNNRFAPGTAPDQVHVAWWYMTGTNEVGSATDQILLPPALGATHGVESSPVVVGGRLYVGDFHGYLYCLDSGTGTLNWKFKTGNAIMGGPACVGGNVYFGSWDYYFYCLDAITGSQKWKFETGERIYGTPTVVGNNVYFGSYDHNVYCLNTADGSMVWNYTTGNGIFLVAPAIVNDRLFIGSTDRYVYCLNATDGALMWRYRTGNSIGQSSAVVALGRVFIGSDDRALYCLNATTANPDGQLLWTRKAPSVLVQYNFQTSCAFAYGKLYAGFYRYLACLDPLTGAEIWHFDPGFVSIASPAIADGRIFWGMNDRVFYIFEAATGKRLQSYTSTAVFESSACIADGRVFIGGTNGLIYCFEQLTPGQSTDLEISAFPESVDVDAPITIEGILFPPVNWVGININFTRPDGTSFVQTIAAKTDGVFRWTFTPGVPGTWTVQASWDGLEDFAGTTSNTLTFTVTGTLALGPSYISAWVDPQTATLGDTTYVRGGTIPSLSGITVTLTYTKPDLTTMTSTVTTGTDGTYEDSITPDAAGIWRVEASWTGDATHQAATSLETWFDVTVPPAGGVVQPVTAAGMPAEVTYGIIAMIVIAIVAIAVVWFVGRKK